MPPSLHSLFNFAVGGGRSTGTRRGHVLALSLLGWEIFKAGSIPPVTLSLIGFMVAIFLRLFSFVHHTRLKEVCVSVYHVWDKRQLRRLALGPLFHADEWHLYYNMASLLWKGKILERRFGSLYFAYFIAVITLIQSAALVVINYVLAEVNEDESHILACAVGFSGVLFTMKVLTTYMEPPSTVQLMGFIPISSKWACWAELVLIQILSPHTSFTGHLSGILVGVALTRGPLKRVVDIPFLSIFGYVPVVHGFEEDSGNSRYSSSGSYTSRQTSYTGQQSQYSQYGSTASGRFEGGGRLGGGRAASMAGDFEDIDEMDDDADVNLEELRRRRSRRFQ